MIKNKRYLTSFSIAIGVHLLIAASLFLSFFHTGKTQALDLLSKKNSLQAYIYHTKSHSLKPKKTNFVKQNVGDISATAEQDDDRENNKQYNAAAKHGDKTTDAFLVILHNTIQSHQHYPRKAQIMQHRGTALIRFNLFPDGHIENASLIASSGVESLDEAALLAVNESAPIKEASMYLQGKKTFTVYVDFL